MAAGLENGIISAVCWVPRGFAATNPERIDLTQEEIKRMKEAEGITDGAADNPTEAPPGVDAALWAKLDMDNYDEGDEQGERVYGGGIKGHMYYDRNEDDPYITLQDDDDDSSIDDFTIKDTDSLILTTRTEEDINRLEVHVYEEENDNVYFHHDVILPTYPLCMAWTAHSPGSGEQGNFCAVGSFLPGISVFNLDVVDVLEPVVTLGGFKRRKNGNFSKKLREGSHSDAIMSLDWNPEYTNVLASGSADGTAKIWDVDQDECLCTFDHHSDKVACVKWNPEESNILLTGSYDGTLAMVDVRQEKAAASAQLTGDLESLLWNPLNPLYFLAATDNGIVTCHDARVTLASGGKSVFTLSAHDKTVSAMCMNPAIPGMLATGSHDKSVKVWDIADNKPSLVYTYEKVRAGKVFSLSFCPDSPFILSAAGSKGSLSILDTTVGAAIRNTFGPRAVEVGAPFPSIAAGPERPVRDDDTSDSDLEDM